MAAFDLVSSGTQQMTAKPESHNADLTHLPAALEPLTHVPHWVLWRWEERRNKQGEPKWTKPPFAPSGGKAETNDPRTWSTYGEVLMALPDFDGIGFVLLGSELTGIDFDDCLDPETGAVDAWARPWLELANGAYVERTPSGTGLRILACDSGTRIQRLFSIPGGRVRARIEVYRNCERYVTVTGAQIGDCASLQPSDIAEKIVAHYDALKGANGANGQHANGQSGGAGNGNGKAQDKPDYDDLLRNGASVPDADRSVLFHQVVWHLAAQGKTLEEVTAEFKRWPDGIGKKYARRLEKAVAASYRKWQRQRTPEPPQPDTGEPEEARHWDKVDRRGKPVSSCTNARRALRVLGVSCRYDVFHDRLLVESSFIRRRDNLDQTVQILRTKIHKAYGFDPGTSNTHDAVLQLCLENEFDPIVDYLAGLTWDNVPRLDRWVITYLGALDTELNREFGRLFLIATVRRPRQPGCKFDPILVLEGPMGTQKSTALQILAGIENFSDQSIFGVSDREQQELLTGVWIYEIAELTNIRKTETEHIKAFASRTHDRARPAYGRTRVDRPRHGTLSATTNDSRYLKDPDRRFWPVATAKIDIEALVRDRDQLWAEAAQRESEGQSIVLRQELWDAARAEQEAREELDPWDDVLVQVVGTVEQDEERVFSRDLLATVLGIHQSKLLHRDSKRLAKCMRRLGWKGPELVRIRGELGKGYRRF
jgi:hypothetical protein